ILLLRSPKAAEPPFTRAIAPEVEGDGSEAGLMEEWQQAGHVLPVRAIPVADHHPRAGAGARYVPGGKLQAIGSGKRGRLVMKPVVARGPVAARPDRIQESPGQRRA